MEKTYTTRTTCRVCGSANLTPLFSLGEQYVSDFVERDKIHAGHRCPIDIELCRDCTLVQAKHTAPQDFLYSRFYWYRSGVTGTMRAALADVAQAAEQRVDLKAGDVVLDIGSNDGTLLRAYTRPGIVRVGVEPATNLAEEGRRGIDFLINDFWAYERYQKDMVMAFGSPMKQARVVTALGMFYDLEDPNQFVADIAKVLAPDGLFIAQLMCLRDMIALSDVGNLSHEHLEFYSYRSLEYLFGRHGLEIFDLETNSVNGQSTRLYVRHKGSPLIREGQSTEDVMRAMLTVKVALAAERDHRLDEPQMFQLWMATLADRRNRCVEFVRREVAAGRQVWVYGSSTKGNVILQWAGLDRSLIQAAADRSPEKWGKFTIGTGIPIVSEEEFRRERPDYALVLPYAFLPEMIERERAWLLRGGKFIVPLPEPRVVSMTADGVTEVML